MKSKAIQKNKLQEMFPSEIIQEIKDVFKESQRIMVVSHIDPDGDALGTQLAFGTYLKDMGKEVFMARDSQIPTKYMFLDNIENILSYDEFPDDLSIDTALVLECPNISRIGGAKIFLGNNVNIINIDHHCDNDNFGRINWLNTRASSVGEMAFEYFDTIGYNFDSSVAEQLYTAIMTDTGRFRFCSTSPRTMEIVARLLEKGADPQRICDNVYYSLKPTVLKLIGKVLNGIEFHNNGNICVLTLTQEMLSASGANDSDSEGLVDFSLYSKDVIGGALFKEIGSDTTKVSLRSKDNVNVAELAAKFDGGGHFNAAGCTLSMPLEKAKIEIIKLLKEAIDDQER